MLPSSFIHSPPASFVLLLFLSPPLPSRPREDAGRIPQIPATVCSLARSICLPRACFLAWISSLLFFLFSGCWGLQISPAAVSSPTSRRAQRGLLSSFLPSFLPWISFPPLRATSPRGNPRGDLSEANPFLWGPLRAPLSPPSLDKYYQMGEVYLDRSVKPEPAANGITQGNQVTNLMSAGWTDERHTHYISSMEASFINRLYNHGNNANKKDSGTNGFKVLQGGARVWKKVEFERPNACAQVGANRSLPANPWIQHFRSRDCCSSSAGGDGAETLVGDHESGIRTIPGRTPLSHGRELGACKAENLLDENSEVSDQNFADDDEAEVGAESSKACKKRRLSSSSTYFVQMTQ